MEKAFDRSQLRQLEKSTKRMSETFYDLCLYNCDMKDSGFNDQCKRGCYDKVIVPFHMVKH